MRNEPYPDDSTFETLRHRMVQEQLIGRDITDAAVLEAMRRVRRHLFVPQGVQADAYQDNPQPIGCGQTISQPYIVASMTQCLHLTKAARVLEIGTGSGYQAAILAELAADVFTIELVPELFDRSSALLQSLGYCNIHTSQGDGSFGWPSEAPFDAIIVTAATPDVPPALVYQLRADGRMVIPVSHPTQGYQDLVLIRKHGERVESEILYPVRFVPLVRHTEERE